MPNEIHYPMPPSPDLPQDWLGDIAREHVVIGDRTYLIDHPMQSERLLDQSAAPHPALPLAQGEGVEGGAADDYLPYWAELWPASRMLAKAILHEPWMSRQPEQLEALEIGCGLGLPGIVALSVGLRVTFSDYDPTALRFAADNARLNGFENFQTLKLDWRSPPDDLRVPVLLASDLVYEIRNVEPLVTFVKSVLIPGGLCLLTDKDRLPSHALREALEDNGLSFSTQTMRAEEPGKRRVKGTLYRIHQR